MNSSSLKKDLKSLFRPHFIIIYLLIVAAYFASRLINLTSIPVFADEGIYIRWAQVMRSEPTLRFLPLSDGKQPLFMWLVIPFLKLISDPLFAGRITSVFAGFGTLLGLSSLIWYITRSKQAVVIGGLFYIITPYSLFFDRMALADSLLAMFAVWSVFIGILFIQHPRLDLAMILGFVLGGGLITKSPGLLFVLLQSTLLLTVTKRQKSHFLKIIAGWTIAGLIAFAIYNVLRLGPNFHMIGARNQDYIFTFSEVVKHPLNPLTGNLKSTLNWLALLLTWPLFSLLLFSTFSKKHSHYIHTFILWILIPIIFQGLIAKVYTPRYLLFIVPVIIVTITLLLSNIQISVKKPIHLFLFFLLITFPLAKSFQILTNPAHAQLPERMRSGYFREWTAGYGIKEIAQYLTERSKDRTVVVGTEGYFGTLPDGLQIYTEGNPNITVIGTGQPVTKTPESLLNSLEEHEVYLVVNSTRNLLTPIELTHLEPIAQYQKLESSTGEVEYLEFFRLHPIAVR